MKRDLNLWDILIGVFFGAAISILTLRLGGYVDSNVSVWGNAIGLAASVLIVVRLLNQKPFRKAHVAHTKGQKTDG